jgi:hypothetical protein
MMSTFFKYSNIFRPVILIGAILLNFFWLNNLFIGLLFGAVYVIAYCLIIGKALFKNFSAVFQILFGSLILFGAVIAIYWINFYLLTLNSILFAGSIIGIAASLELIDFTGNKEKLTRTGRSLFKTLSEPWKKLRPKPLIAAYMGLIALEFYQLIKHASDSVIDSPWNLLSDKFFIIFFIASLILVITILFNRKNTAALIAAHAFLMASVSFFIYKIGYGYDPFIHLATEKLILSTGTLEPKPYFYIGYYSLVIFLSQLLTVSIDSINKLIVPAGFALYAPGAIYFGLKYGWRIKTRNAQLTALAFLTLPLNYFISSTPQGLTNLIALLVVFLSFVARKEKNIAFLNVFLGMIAMMIHPFFGAPLTLFAIYSLMPHIAVPVKIKLALKLALATVAAVIFPVMFFANAKMTGLAVNFVLPSTEQLKSINLLAQKTHWQFVSDFIYLYGFNYKTIFVAVAVCGLIFALFTKRFRKFKDTALFALLFIINFLITRFFLNLDFLGANDKLQFSGRIFELAVYFMAPLFLYAIYRFIRNVWTIENNFPLKSFASITLCIGLGAGLYFSYPIFDLYKNSKEYNVTASDISAVQFIQSHASGGYIVLANQMVGAAAIKEFGFAKYYGDEFYYSMPNAGQKKLYALYEKMVFENRSGKIWKRR